MEEFLRERYQELFSVEAGDVNIEISQVCFTKGDDVIVKREPEAFGLVLGLKGAQLYFRFEGSQAIFQACRLILSAREGSKMFDAAVMVDDGDFNVRFCYPNNRIRDDDPVGFFDSEKDIFAVELIGPPNATLTYQGENLNKLRLLAKQV